MASIGSDHRLTKHSRFGMAMECGVPSGVVVKFKQVLFYLFYFYIMKRWGDWVVGW